MYTYCFYRFHVYLCAIKQILYIMELRVKDICKEKGILFKELAEKLNVSDIGLRASLKGNPTIGTLEKIAEALGVPFTELFERPKSDTASLTCPNCGKNINIKVE
jgi:DNA-binding phage protein